MKERVVFVASLILLIAVGLSMKSLFTSQTKWRYTASLGEYTGGTGVTTALPDGQISTK